MKDTQDSNDAAFGFVMVYIAFPWLLIPTFIALLGWGVYRLLRGIIGLFKREL